MRPGFQAQRQLHEVNEFLKSPPAKRHSASAGIPPRHMQAKWEALRASRAMCLLGRAVEMLRALEMNEAIGEDLWMFSGPLLMALPAEATEKQSDRPNPGLLHQSSDEDAVDGF